MKIAESLNIFKNKSVLITGGLGFIGSNLAIKLAQHGANVTVLDSLVPEFGGNLHNIQDMTSSININISDMRDKTSLNILVQNKDYIFHLAGQVSHGDSMREPETDLHVNCVSTINLVEACRHVNPTAKLIYTSTRQVYGAPQNLPVTEDHPQLPIDVNGINKLAGEYYHLLYDRVYGLKSVVLRLTNTYGPRQQIRNNRQGFIGIFIRQALKGEKINVFGTGEQVRDFNHVDDTVNALILAATNENCYGRVFNLGAEKYYSVLDLVNILKETCNIEFDIIPFPENKKIIDIGDCYSDYSRFKKETGWHPTIELPAGIASTIDFYRQHPEVYWA